jgi:aspartate racemase
MSVEDWEPVYAQLADAAKKIEASGADFLVLAANTMHRFADRLQTELSIPMLHIADCVAKECLDSGVNRVALLGTVFTMRQAFLKDRLASNGMDVVIPASEVEQEKIYKIIVDELTFGRIREESRSYYKHIIERMAETNGVQGVILGCTEIEMLIKPGDVSIPVFDTTQAHINAAVEMITTQ